MIFKLLMPVLLLTSLNVSASNAIGGSISLDAYDNSSSEKLSFYCSKETKTGVCEEVSILSQTIGNSIKHTNKFSLIQSEEKITEELERLEKYNLSYQQSEYYYPISGAYNDSVGFDSAKGNIDALGKITIMLGALLVDTVILIPAVIYAQGEKVVRSVSSSERDAYDFMLDSANQGETLEVSEVVYDTIRYLVK